ncbi:hypothetical protein [Streptomyces sp. PSAA01]|uniref:hypothetical protein n=1 Tax=Streptomyces sp. PSAA01 TaxID=2912762 RepID=UPI001F1EA591|nr:hypothetical protein [Streptomyces sp. PSAA01]MCG0283643.1 hypothetical protein [Streptomyces sp. PSAA01]
MPSTAGSVSLYRVDFGSEIGEVPRLQTCFYDTATPTATARIADARALVARAQTLWNLPGPAREEANARAADAIAVAREVVALDAGFRATLAQWLVFPAGTYLMASGHHDDAIARMQEALGLYDRLIAEQPGSDDLRYRKAWTLVNLARALWGKPDHTRGAQRAVEATDLLRRLATENPGRFRGGLGDWLMYPTIPYLRQSGRTNQALARAREAVDIFTALNATDPATHGPKPAAAKKLVADIQAEMPSGDVQSDDVRPG